MTIRDLATELEAADRPRITTLLRDTLSGRALFPGDPDTPEETIAAAYHRLHRTTRRDIENATLELVRELVTQLGQPHAAWCGSAAVSLLALTDPIFTDSPRRDAMIDELLAVVDSAVAPEGFVGMALAGLVHMRCSLPVDFWQRCYSARGNACMGPILDGLALHSYSALCSFLPMIDWTPLAEDAFVTFFLAQAEELTGSLVSTGLATASSLLPKSVRDTLATFLPPTADPSGVPDTAAWYLLLRPQLRPGTDLVGIARARIDHSSDPIAARSTLGVVLVDILTHGTTTDVACAVRLLELSANVDTISAALAALTLSPAQEPDRVQAETCRQSTTAALGGAARYISAIYVSGTASFNAELGERLRRTLLCQLSAHDDVATLELAIQVFQKADVEEAILHYLLRESSKVGPVRATLASIYDVGAIRALLADVYRRSIETSTTDARFWAVARKLQEDDPLIYEVGTPTSMPSDDFIALQDELVPRDGFELISAHIRGHA